jgi:adenylate kinase
MGKQRNIIVLTGVPGVGKTTIADIIAERINGVHIELSKITHVENLIDSRDDLRNTGIVNLERMRILLTQIHDASNEPMIIEGHFASDVVPREWAPFIFVLRKAPWVLIRELESRGYGGEKIWENLDAELVGISLSDAIEAYGPESICEIDTTGRNPEEVSDEIISIVKGENKCRHGHIDWLGHDESRRLLESR